MPIGIYLASLGGDGGTGAAIDGSGGASDPIDVSISSATVTTSGVGSHGVYAISQGGDGADSSNSGDGGDGDFVTLHVTSGTINVSGEDAYGIAAMSLAGSGGSGDAGTAGDVTLTTGASVTASGSGGSGLYVESTNGTIDVTVDSGATITASDDATAAISFVNGDTNTLTNYGTITTDDLTTGSSIYALKSSGNATLDVSNYGTFSGSVYLAEVSTFTNNSGATLNVGGSLNLGTTGTLTNDGTISPGGSGTVLTSTVEAGTFSFGDGSTYLVDIDGSSTDELSIEAKNSGVYGTNSVAGTVEVNVITSPSSSGSSRILYSQGTFDVGSLTVSDTATADYSLDTSSDFYVALEWSVDMANPALLGSANDNQRRSPTICSRSWRVARAGSARNSPACSTSCRWRTTSRRSTRLLRKSPPTVS